MLKAGTALSSVDAGPYPWSQGRDTHWAWLFGSTDMAMNSAAESFCIPLHGLYPYPNSSLVRFAWLNPHHQAMQSEKVLMTVQKAFNLFYFISYSLVLWLSLGQDVVGTHLEQIFGLGLL